MRGRFPRDLPLLLPAPLFVGVLGVATALSILLLGTDRIRATRDEAAATRAGAVAEILAVRFEETPRASWAPLLRQAQETLDVHVIPDPSGAELPAEFLTPREKSFTVQRDGQRYIAELRPIGKNAQVAALVSAPESPPETFVFIQTVLALTVLLVGVAVVVTYSYARATQGELLFLRAQLSAIARKRSARRRTIAIRSLDEVGLIGGAFNALVRRYSDAESRYAAHLEQVSRNEAERLEFLAGLSHELRTPLNAILGFSHILESGVDGPLSPEVGESVEVIRTSGEHLRTLIDDILDLSALETGELKLTKGPADLRRIASEVIREAASLTRDKELHLTVSGETFLWASGDKRRLRQILTNLVYNAIKFTPRGSVNIDLASTGGWATVAVVDTGYGIPPEELSTIFDAYRQGNAAHSRKGGVGLGLATVKRLVAMHGGSIEVTSKPGEGSTFRFSVPLATEAELDDAVQNRPTFTGFTPGEGKAET